MISDPQHEIVIDIHRRWDTRLTLMDGPRDPEEEGSFQWGSDTKSDEMGPTVYVFSNNDVPNIRNTGVPERTTRFRSSFDPDPHWLDDTTWYDDDGRSRFMVSEVKGGLCLDSIQQ